MNMNTLSIILSVLAVVLSGGALSVALSNKARLDALETAPAGPDVGTMGAGGGGHR